MVLANPLPQASFADLIKVQDVSFLQGWQQQRSATGGGETRYADRAPPLWKITATTIAVTLDRGEAIMALINSRGGGLKTALLHNYRLPYPASDPDGSILDDAIPKLGAIADRLHVAFTAFPPNYVLPLGTFFGLVFDTSRYYLGQVLEDRVANGVGNVASVEIWPPLPASVVGTLDVNLKKPPAKFRITPGSAFPSKVGPTLTTIQFAAEQTYSR